MKKTQGPYKSPSEDVKSPEVSFMKFWKLSVKSGSQSIFSYEEWLTEKVLSWENYITIRKTIEDDYGFDCSNLWESFRSLSNPDNFLKYNSTTLNASGVVFKLLYIEFPMHPDIPLLAELKQEVKKTLKIYQDEENVIKSLIMSRAVTNLCKYHF